MTSHHLCDKGQIPWLDRQVVHEFIPGWISFPGPSSPTHIPLPRPSCSSHSELFLQTHQIFSSLCAFFLALCLAFLLVSAEGLVRAWTLETEGLNSYPISALGMTLVFLGVQPEAARSRLRDKEPAIYLKVQKIPVGEWGSEKRKTDLLNKGDAIKPATLGVLRHVVRPMNSMAWTHSCAFFTVNCDSIFLVAIKFNDHFLFYLSFYLFFNTLF